MGGEAHGWDRQPFRAAEWRVRRLGARAPPSNAYEAPKNCVPKMSFSAASYHARPGEDTSSTQSKIDQCLSDILASSFLRIASKESDLDRVGYEYYVGPLLRVEHAAQAAD